MPFLAQDLIEDRPKPVSVSANVPVVDALKLMIENDFSQLPIIDDEQYPLGLITSDSILRALNNFGITIKELYVRDAAESVKEYSLDDSIFDLLEGLDLQPAVLIVDGDGRLVGIMTSFDTTAYFRRRAEDMMVIEDIESALVDHIEAAFTNSRTGKLDEQALFAAIHEVSNAQTHKNAQEAIRRYLRHLEDHKPNPEWIEQVCAELGSQEASLNDLTLYQYTELLLHKSRWVTYSSNFRLDEKAIRKLLNDVRETRNVLAHFRDEITMTQREQLHFCADWLERNPPPVFTEVADTAQVAEIIQNATQDELLPVEEELTDKDSRYTRLALHLQSQPGRVDKLPLSFEQIEGIIEGELPPSSKHRSWWVNDSVGHVQSKQWLSAGWRVSRINTTQGEVIFTRIAEREKAYIDFFSQVITDLEQQADFPIRKDSPMGVNWHSIGLFRNDEGRQVASLTFSFARNQQFRTELYIDSGDGVWNKEIFDLLQNNQDDIEDGLARILGTQVDTDGTRWELSGVRIKWERLNERRASRIALYRPGSITDELEELAEIREWAVRTMIAFQHVICQWLNDFKYRG